MFPIFVATLVARGGGDAVTLPSPNGHGQLTIQVPSGYRIANRQSAMVILQSGAGHISITWSARVVTPKFLAAMRLNTEKMRAEHKVVGTVSIGPYSGTMLRLPLRPDGLDIHCAMTSGSSLLSISYFNPAKGADKSATAVPMVRRLISTAQLTGR